MALRPSGTTRSLSPLPMVRTKPDVEVDVLQAQIEGLRCAQARRRRGSRAGPGRAARAESALGPVEKPLHLRRPSGCAAGPTPAAAPARLRVGSEATRPASTAAAVERPDGGRLAGPGGRAPRRPEPGSRGRRRRRRGQQGRCPALGDSPANWRQVAPVRLDGAFRQSLLEAEGAQMVGEHRVLGCGSAGTRAASHLGVFDRQDVLQREVGIAGRLGHLAAA